MNWYIVLAAFLLGVPVGMWLEFLMIKNKIMSKEIHVNTAKVKGQGNAQDLDMEFQESETLKTRRQLRKEKRVKENQSVLNQVRNNLKNKIEKT